MGITNLVDGVAVYNVKVGGELDQSQVLGDVYLIATDNHVVAVLVAGGTDGKQGLAVVRVILIKLLKHDAGEQSVVECLGIYTGNAGGNGYVSGLGGGAEHDLGVYAGGGVSAQNTVNGAEGGVGRVNVDSGKLGVALEDLIYGVVIVDLVVLTDCLQVGRKGDSGEGGVGECAVLDDQLKSLVAVLEGNGGESGDLECILTNEGEGCGEVCGGKACSLEGGCADGGNAVTEHEGGNLGVVECICADIGQNRALGNSYCERCGGDVGECISTNVGNACGEIDLCDLGLLEYTVAGSSGGGTDGQALGAFIEVKGGESGYVVECTVTDGSNACGNGDGCDLGVGKGAGTNGGNACRNGESGDLGAVECLVADALNAAGQSYGGEVEAVVECAVADLFKLVGLGGVEAYGGETRAVCKCLIADLNYVRADNQGLDALVVLEYGGADLFDLVPRKLGEIAVHCLGVVCQLEHGAVLDSVVKNAALGVEVGVAVSYLDGLNGETALEYRTVKALESCGKLDGLQNSTVVEHGVAEAYGLLALAEGEGYKLGAALEGIVADVLGACVNGEFLESGAVLKYVVANGLEGCILVDVNARELGVALEGVVAEGCDVNVCTHGEGGKACAVLECGSTDGDLAESLCVGAEELNGGESGSLECCVSDGERAVSGSLNGKGGEESAVCKCVCSDMAYGGGNYERGDGDVVLEQVVSDSADTLGNGELTVEGSGNVKDGETCGVGIAEQVAYRGVNKAAFLNQKSGEGVKGVEAGHAAVKRGNKCGQLESVNLGKAVEGTVINGNGGASAVFEFDGLKVSAAVECALGKVSNVLGDDYLGDGALIECEGTDGGNVLGNGELTGLGHGEVLKVDVGGCLVLVNEGIAKCIVELLVGALSSCIGCEGGELGASLESTYTDVGESVGEGDGGEGGAVLEAVLKNLGNCNALILCGDLDLCNGAYLGAGFYTVGSVLKENVGEQIGVGIKIRIEGNVVGEGVYANALALCVGNELACAVGLGVPAAEEADNVIRGLGNGKSESAVEGYLLSGALGNVCNDVGINAESDVILVGDPVCKEGQASVAGEYGVGELLAVCGSSAGNVVPAAEGVACIGEICGDGESVAKGNVLGDITGHGAGHVGDLVGGDLKGYPLGLLKIGAANLDEVDACLGEDDGSAVLIAYGNNLAAVYTNLKVLAAENGGPGNGVLGVGEGSIKLEVTDGYGLAVLGCLAVVDGANGDIVNLAGFKVDTGGLEIEAVGGDGEGLLADANLVLSNVAALPGNGSAVNGELGGSCGSGLIAVSLGSRGRDVSVSYGGYLDGNVAGVIGKGEGVGNRGEGESTVSGGQLDSVLCGIGNEIPNEGIGALVVGDAGNSGELLLVDKGLGDGACIACGLSGNGELDSTLLHGAVCKVVSSGASVIEESVLVVLVAAIHGDQVLLCVLNGGENEDAVNNLEVGNSAQCLVLVVTNGGIGVLLGVARGCDDLNGVIACGKGGEVHCNGGLTDVGLVEDLGTVGRLYLDGVGDCAVYRIPFDGGIGNGNSGRSELLAVLCRPNCEQSGVGIKHGAVGKLFGELVPVLIHTDEPADKVVVVAGGGGNAVELAADGGHGLDLGCALVSEYEGCEILSLTDRLFRPTGIDGGVLGDGGAEIVCGLVGRISIPADEYEAVANGIAGLQSKLAVDNGSILNGRTAGGVILDGVENLLEEGESLTVEIYLESIVLNGGGCGAVLILCKIKGDLGTVNGVLARFVVARAGE